MTKTTNSNQIIRIDGKNVFVEVLNSAFEIGKVQMNFIEYDVTKEKNNRIQKRIPIYIDIDEFLVIVQDALSGLLSAMAKKAKEEAKSKGYKYCKEIKTILGGVSAKTLKERGEEREDGLSLSRQFKITPGDKKPWILSGEKGAGEENETGLIVPKGKPEEIVRVPMSNEDFKKFILVTKMHIEAFITAKYVAQMKEKK